jgi:DNA repair protein RadC
MAITDWPEDERPRERLLAHGARLRLSDAELLAIFLRVGSRGKSCRGSGARVDRAVSAG